MTDTLSGDELKNRVAAHLAEHPRAMTMSVARELGVPEAEVLRALPAEVVTELAADQFKEMMDAMAEWGQVHVIVSNGVTTLEAFGQFGNFSVWGEFFNVQTKSLDMHIRHEQIGAVFAVAKPSHLDGVPTLSIQFYSREGHSAFKVFLTFGAKAPSPEKTDRWTRFRDQFRLASNRHE